MWAWNISACTVVRCGQKVYQGIIGFHRTVSLCTGEVSFNNKTSSRATSWRSHLFQSLPNLTYELSGCGSASTTLCDQKVRGINEHWSSCANRYIVLVWSRIFALNLIRDTNVLFFEVSSKRRRWCFQLSSPHSFSHHTSEGLISKSAWCEDICIGP
jgi:hypothetical protein